MPGPVQLIDISGVFLHAVRFISENACTGLPADQELEWPDRFLELAGGLSLASEGRRVLRHLSTAVPMLEEAGHGTATPMLHAEVVQWTSPRTLLGAQIALHVDVAGVAWRQLLAHTIPQQLVVPAG